MADVVEEAAWADASGRTPGEQVREQEERPPTMADSQGERALVVCLARPAAFSQMMPLAVHPRAKHSLALRLRILCRRALRLGSALHRRLCWQLLGHPGEDVRSHIWCLVRYEGQSIWRAGGRDASEITDSGDCYSRMGRDGRTWAICRCDPLRDIVEGIMLPCASKTLSQEGMRRWLLVIRNTIYVCGCGTMYHHLRKEALSLAHRQRSALRTYVYLVYARLQRGLPSKRRAALDGEIRWLSVGS